MLEPIAVALACVGMKLQSQSPAKDFVCNIFRDQREKLIGELTLEELCSYLHALSLYQIEGLLSSNRYEAPFSSAELHHEYLIKITRRLSRTHRAEHSTSYSLCIIYWALSFAHCDSPCAEDLWDAPNADEWALVRQRIYQQQFNPLSVGEVLDTVNIGRQPFDQVSRLGTLGGATTTHHQCCE